MRRRRDHTWEAAAMGDLRPELGGGDGHREEEATQKAQEAGRIEGGNEEEFLEGWATRRSRLADGAHTWEFFCMRWAGLRCEARFKLLYPARLRRCFRMKWAWPIRVTQPTKQPKVGWGEIFWVEPGYQTHP